MRLVDTYYICTYIGSTCLRLLQKPLSLQHDMLSELCTDFTATLHLSPGLYSSYSRLSWFMSILYIICASCVFSPHARLPCILLSFVTFHFTPLLSQIIPCISNAGSHSSSCSFRFTWHCLAFVFQGRFVPLDHIPCVRVLMLLCLFLVWVPSS